MRRRLALLLILLAVTAACGDDGGSAEATPAPTSSDAPTTTAAAATTTTEATAPTTTEAPATLVQLGGPGTAALDGSGLELTVENGTGELAPGWTLFNARFFGPEAPHGFALAVDESGEIVWSIKDRGFVGDITVTSAGTVMYILDDRTLREVDADGHILRDYLSRDATLDPEAPHPQIEVDVRNFHHEVAEQPNGNLLTVSSEIDFFSSDTPMCGEDPGAGPYVYEVIGDAVHELDRDTGAVVWARSTWDLFDPMEWPGSDLCAINDPLAIAPDRPEAADWSHVNAAALTPDGDEILVSARHLDAVWAWPADPTEEGVRWILGPGPGGILVPPEDRFARQHAPEQQPDGTVLLYDNGPSRAEITGAEVDEDFSRVVQYAIDPEAGTAELLWEYRREGADGPIFAAVVGDVDRLPNGNTLVTDGFLPGFRPQIVEIDPEGEIVRLMTLSHPEFGWLVYRAERIEPLG